MTIIDKKQKQYVFYDRDIRRSDLKYNYRVRSILHLHKQGLEDMVVAKMLGADIKFVEEVLRGEIGERKVKEVACSYYP